MLGRSSTLYHTAKEKDMSDTHIQKSVESLLQYYTEHPDKARSPDKPATAVIEEGLRCRVEWAGGATIISDMPKGLGGSATAPTPGWLSRAALATCDATTIALRAAQLGVSLTTLEVTVESVSDDRGLLGMDDSIPAGLLNARIRVRIGAEGASPERLREIIEWAEIHSPVGDTVRRAVPCKMEVEVI
jgi:uncharacterized OsmC-like protein